MEIKKYKAVISIFIISFFTLLLFQSNYITDLSSSRIMTIQALTEYGTFAIDDIPYFTTIDKIFHNGHFYSSKPPFVSILGALVYFVIKLFTDATFNIPTYTAIKIFTVILPFSLLLVFFYKSLQFGNISNKSKVISTFLLGFATLLFPYSVILQNHTMSAFLIFISFYCILRYKFDGEKNYLLLLAGLFVSLSITTEFVQSSLIWLVFFGYILYTLKNKKNILWFLAGSFPIAILYMLYNTHTTGSILPPYANFESLYGYENSYWQNPTGIDAFSHPKLLYFFNILFGTHGLFLYSPILILGCIGFYKNIKNKKNILREISIISATTLALVIFIIGVFTHNYGGTTLGMRWFIILMPLLMFFAVPIIDKIKKPVHITLLSIVIVWSIFLNYYGMHHKWNLSTFTVYDIEMASPIYDIFKINF